MNLTHSQQECYTVPATAVITAAHLYTPRRKSACSLHASLGQRIQRHLIPMAGLLFGVSYGNMDTNGDFLCTMHDADQKNVMVPLFSLLKKPEQVYD